MAFVENDSLKLTQFAAPGTDGKSTPNFLRRLIPRQKGVHASSSMPAINYNPVEESVHSIPLPAQQKSISSDDFTSSNKINPTAETRSFTGVLSRIMNLLEKKSVNEGIKPYKESDFRQSWMPDSSCKECYDCGNHFTTFLRRHHCRICGQIFCSRCCNQEVPGRVIGLQGGLRACTYCCGVVSNFVMQMEGSEDLCALKDNLKAQLSRHDGDSGQFTPSRSVSAVRRFSEDIQERSSKFSTVFDRAPSQEPVQMTKKERLVLVEESQQLKALFYEMLRPMDGAPLSTKRHRLRTYHNCCYGHELVAWLMDTDKASERLQAIAIGQALMDAKYIFCITEVDHIFSDDYSLYKFKETSVGEQQFAERINQAALPRMGEEEPNWVQELDEASNGDVSVETSVAGLSVSTAASVQHERSKFYIGSIDASYNSRHEDVARNSMGSELLINQKDDNNKIAESIFWLPDRSTARTNATKDSLIHEHLKEAYKKQLGGLCLQLLDKYKLSSTWSDVLMNLAENISCSVRPDVKLNKDNMDIGAYVHIKKVRSGVMKESTIVYGVVCTKNTVHKKMATCVKTPQIMLLQSSIEYQRVTNKLSSLDPQILQEQEYLQNCVARIVRYKPDVLLVENTVSRVAQELLLDAGITLVVNVKQCVMQRVSRMTMADIIGSIDSLLSKPQLGTCYKFETRTFRFTDGFYKTLMYFDGCPNNLGCTVMLRSESYEELAMVKPILMMMIFACYNAKLEIAYFMDQSAVAPVDCALKDKLGPCRNSCQSLCVDSTDTLGTSPRPDVQYSNMMDVEPNARYSSTNRMESGFSLRPGAPDAPPPNSSSPRFLQILDWVILDCSPFTKVEPPYFETSKGHHCRMRKLFPSQPYWSSLLSDEIDSPKPLLTTKNELYDYRMEEGQMKALAAELFEPHSFVNWRADCSVENIDLKRQLTRFRASGARLRMKQSPCFVLDPFSDAVEDDNYSDVPDSLDCFDIQHHQRISVLFSSYSPISAHACVNPWVVNMQFYGRNDMTLGQFLESYCFREGYRCPKESCVVPMLDHIRRFVHDTGCLYLILKKLPPNSEKQQNDMLDKDKSLLTWNWCRKCKKTTNPVPLSPATWHLSFAKFIQLRIKCTLHGSRAAEDCSHSLCKDYYQYFKSRDLVATFRYNGVSLLDVCFPPEQIIVPPSVTQTEALDRLKTIHSLGMNLYSGVMKSLHKLETLGSENEARRNLINQHKCDVEGEKASFLTKIDRLQLGFGLPDNVADVGTVSSLLYPLEDEMVSLKIDVARAFCMWNHRITKIAGEKKDDKRNSKVLSEPSLMQSFKVFDKDALDGPAEKELTEAAEAKDELTPTFNLESGDPSASKPDPGGPVLSYQPLDTLLFKKKVSETTCESDASRIPTDFQEPIDNYYQQSSSSSEASFGESREDQLSSQEFDDVIYSSVAPGIEAAIYSSSNYVSPSQGSLVKTSSPAERSSPTLSPINGTDSAQLTAPAAAAEEIYRPAADESEILAPSINTAQIEYCLDKQDFPEATDLLLESSRVEDIDVDFLAQMRRERKYHSSNDLLMTYSNSSKQKQVKKNIIESLKTMISPFEEDTSIVNPFSDAEHYLLQPTITVPVVVCDEEPSSIIAYTLGSQSYEDHMIELQKQMLFVRPHPKFGSTVSLQDHYEADPNRFGFRVKEKPEPPAPNQHVEFQFTEKTEGGEKTALFYCKVYFALEFKRLRRLILPQGEEHFIRSLSHCFKWNAKGGKSGLSFCKTKDERFIIKQMNRQEVQSFLEFGPNFFEHQNEAVKSALNKKATSLLAKILGVYRISFQNFLTGAAMKQDVLVMENLFYKHRITKVFDLKGSERNRLAKKDSASGRVLLDENFVHYIKHYPVYMRPHARKVLLDTLMSDTQFLASHTVMDYSLLCGLDEDTKELVVGVIDYIRTFTWDKKLETVVKSSGILGGQGKMPTIVSPEVYRTRFLEAMERYFHAVPDRWSGLGRDDY